MNQFTRLLFVFGLLLSSFWGAWAKTSVWPPKDPAKIACINLGQPIIRADTCARGLGRIILPHDGTPPFSYTWSHDSTLDDSIADNLVTGQYQVTVSDDAGCTAERTIRVASVNPLSVPVNTSPDTCGAGNGSASVNINRIGGGVAPYTFAWDSTAGGMTTPTATGLTAGTYSVTVTDAQGCIRVVSATVDSETNDFSVDVSSNPAECFGEPTGQAAATVTGGNTGSYGFQWIPLGDTTVISTDSILIAAEAGNYRLRVFDEDGGLAGGCVFNGVVAIAQPDSFIASALMTPTTECGIDNGELVAQARGGTPPYQYRWGNGSTDQTISNLGTGFYQLAITDSNGCTASTEVSVTSEPGPEFDVEILQEDNCGQSEGIARVRVERGTPPYEVVWATIPRQPSDTSLSAYDLSQTRAGQFYTATVIDAAGCLQQQRFTVPGRAPLTLEIADVLPDYCDLANGQASVVVSGGTPPYNYRWSTTPATRTSTVTDLPAGSYQIRVLDSFDCDASAEVQIVDDIGFELSVETTDETCLGTEDGEARALISGGEPPFSYEWNTEPIQRTPVALRLSGGVYNVEVRDNAGCERRAFGKVESTPAIEPDFTFTPGIDTPIVLSRATFEFINQSIGADTYQWTFGDGNTAVAANPIHIYEQPGNYYVKLRAFNTEGCVDSITYGPLVVVEGGGIVMPNAFTPNDDEYNDRFVVQAYGLDQFELNIYNQWGIRVFSSQSVDNTWDGTYEGRPAPVGMYVVVLQARGRGGERYEQIGNLFLVR